MKNMIKFLILLGIILAIAVTITSLLLEEKEVLVSANTSMCKKVFLENPELAPWQEGYRNCLNRKSQRMAMKKGLSLEEKEVFYASK